MYGYTLSTGKLPLYYLVEQDLLGAPQRHSLSLSDPSLRCIDHDRDPTTSTPTTTRSFAYMVNNLVETKSQTGGG